MVSSQSIYLSVCEYLEKIERNRDKLQWWCCCWLAWSGEWRWLAPGFFFFRYLFCLSFNFVLSFSLFIYLRSHLIQIGSCCCCCCYFIQYFFSVYILFNNFSVHLVLVIVQFRVGNKPKKKTKDVSNRSKYRILCHRLRTIFHPFFCSLALSHLFNRLFFKCLF